MAMKKVAMTNVKLKAGSSIEGYLLSKTLREIDGDDGKFSLCKAVLKTDKLGNVVVWLQEDYFHGLALGFKTKVEKVETNIDGEKGVRTDVSQDDADFISVK